MENISTEVLQNCTVDVINKYPELTSHNDSDIWLLNRTNVLDILGDMYDKFQKTHVDIPLENEFRDFLSNCLLSSKHEKPYELPWQQKTIWSMLFGAMLVVAISGNSIVLWIVLAHRRMRTVTNYFLLNLSVADLLMATLNTIFNFVFMLDSDWPFGALYCTINNFIANLSVAASVFTLVAITFDRYIAITRPLQHRTSRKKARIFLLIIWATSCVLAAPCLMFSTISTRTYSNGKTRTVCFMSWPDGVYPESLADYLYNIVFLIVTYLIPIIVMLFCYSIMGKELWGSGSIGEQTERQKESMKSKKKVVRMFVVVVTIFAVCWLPYHLFFIYSYHNSDMMSTSYVQHLYLSFYWLAMSNAMVNPLIYYWMNGRFRVYFKQIICFCCVRLWKQRYNENNLSPKGILLEKNSHSDLGRSRSCRQKTLSVKWRQSTAETKLRDRKQNHVKIEPIVDNNNGVENLCQESLITLSPNSITNTTHLTTLTTHNSDIDLSYNPNSRSFRRTVNRIGTTRRDDTKNGTYLFNGKSDSC